MIMMMTKFRKKSQKEQKLVEFTIIVELYLCYRPQLIKAMANEYSSSSRHAPLMPNLPKWTFTLFALLGIEDHEVDGDME
jgi:hypothetical protein